MPTSLSANQTRALLDELCSVLGFCLPPAEIARLQDQPLDDVESFVTAVVTAEGFTSVADIPVHLYGDMKARVTAHFRNAEDVYIASGTSKT